MPTIQQTYIIAGLPQDVWDSLTDPSRIQQWSGKPADFKPEPGTEYWLWDGDIRGQVVEVVPGERLVQTWKPRNWDVEDSVVTFRLTPTQDGTQVDLEHTNVQDWDYDSTADGWDIYYVGAIKRMIEGTSAKREPTTKKRAAAKKGQPKRKNAPGPKKTATGTKATAKGPKITAKKAAKKSAAKKSAAKKSAGKKGATRKTAAKRGPTREQTSGR